MLRDIYICTCICYREHIVNIVVGPVDGRSALINHSSVTTAVVESGQNIGGVVALAVDVESLA